MHAAMHYDKQDAAHLLHPRKHQAEAPLGAQALQQVSNVIAAFLHGLTPLSFITGFALEMFSLLCRGNIATIALHDLVGASACTLFHSMTFDSKLPASPAAQAKHANISTDTVCRAADV